MKLYLKIIFCLLYVGVNAQNQPFLDVEKIEGTISPNFELRQVEGGVNVQFSVLKSVDSVYLDARDFTFSKVELNQVKAYKATKKHLIIYGRFIPNESYTLQLSYKVNPRKAFYFIETGGGSHQMWTQGQGKYTSHWLPSIDDVNDKIIFDLTINYSKEYKVLSNGTLKSKVTNGGETVWRYAMSNPMSSYLVAVVIGKYNSVTQLSKSNVPLEFYYLLKDSLKVEPTYRYSRKMFNFLEKEIGVSYPWNVYRQLPVKDFMYAGMENTGLTTFSSDFVVDAIGFNDNNYVNVNAHELAHQWFGDLVTAQSSEHHWLQEGFATYYALLAEKNIYGDKHYYWKLYQYAQELSWQDKNGMGTSLLNPKSTSTTFYKRGAWVLHLLRRYVGDKVFKKSVKRYLGTYAFKNVKTENFLSIIEEESGISLKEFKEKWIISKSFNIDLANENLKASPFITEYLMSDCEVKKANCDYLMVSGISDKAKARLIQQRPKLITSDFFKNSWEVRQAIAKSIKKVPYFIKKDYESLLKDSSYITRELALYNLWNTYPKDRFKYLDEIKGQEGLANKSLTMLWLALAINTKGYNESKVEDYIKTLNAYTASKYDFNVRKSATEFLMRLGQCKDVCVENLKKGTKHHNWRFVKFCRGSLKLLNVN